MPTTSSATLLLSRVDGAAPRAPRKCPYCETRHFPIDAQRSRAPELLNRSKSPQPARTDTRGPTWSRLDPGNAPRPPPPSELLTVPFHDHGPQLRLQRGQSRVLLNEQALAPAVKGSTRTGMDWTGQRPLHSPPLKRRRSAENAGGKPTGGLEPPTPSLRGIRKCPTGSTRVHPERTGQT